MGRQGARPDRRRGRAGADPGRADRHGRAPPLGVVRMTSRRILITGVSTFWGGRLAQALEREPGVETIIGVGPDDPSCSLERTEYVRVGLQHALLKRIVQAAEIDTVVDTRLVVDSLTASPRVAHEANAIGTLNILAACGGPSTPVRKVVFKSSAHYYGCERDDPAFFTEAMRRPHPPRTRLESDILEAEKAVRGSPSATGTSRSPCCASATRSDRGSAPRTPSCSRCRRSRPSSASTRGTSSSTRTTRRRARFAVERDLRASTTPPATGARALRGRVAARPAARADPAALGHLAGRRARCGRSASASRTRSSPAALRSGARQPQAQGRGLRVRLHQPRDRAQAAEASGSRRCSARGGRRTATSARSRSSCAGAPVSGERAPCNASVVAGVPTVCRSAYHPGAPCRAR